jgi:PHD/YefM family antitoxin component YafN of YafNO toxin-antitoxin module
MPYALPTVNEFRARLPEFADTENGDITAGILAASDFIDDSWIEADYKPALIYLAAHLMSMQAMAIAAGGGSSGGSVNAGDGDVYVSNVNVEGRSISWGVKAGARSTTNSSSGASIVSAGSEFWKRTFYGQLFEKLLRRNVIPVLVIGEQPPYS